MKKTILLLLASGIGFAAVAQNPDTTRQFNSVYPDSTRLTTQPVDTTVTPNLADSVLVPPAQPMSTDVKEDTVPIPTPPATVPSATDTMQVVVPSVTLPASDSVVVPAPAASTVTAPATDIPAANNNVTTNNNASLPRGVNNSTVAITGLTRWSALPILNTWVPQDVVDKAKSEYGDKLYDITTLKTGENQYSYSVRVQENGVYKSVLMGETSNGNMQ